MLKKNFEMMLKMRRYLPSLEISMSRLRTFHQQCQNNMDTSFEMDQWMLQFLQRYIKPVTDKTTSLSHIPDEVGSLDMPEWQAEILDTGVN
jgi:hypothetical protein